MSVDPSLIACGVMGYLRFWPGIVAGYWLGRIVMPASCASPVFFLVPLYWELRHQGKVMYHSARFLVERKVSLLRAPSEDVDLGD